MRTCSTRLFSHASSSERKEFPMESELPLRCHTTRYERFFVLSLDLRFDRQKAELSGIDSNRVYLRVPHGQQPSWLVPCETLLTWAEAAGKECGISHVARICCGRLPMMEVDFPSKSAIVTLLKSLREGNFQKHLQTMLKKQIEPECSSLSVYVRLFLSIPVGECYAYLREVTLSNLNACVKMLKEGRKLDYGNIMSENQFLPHKRSMQHLILTSIYVYTITCTLQIYISLFHVM